ncbi:MAG: hypothetical protein KatS3mg061_0857 [Dehalococcoidia bacterium]|nr:MAG: hypothetical protein KatS3mg061_0857 [Dehalococcoidia bacterium]
MTLLAPTASLDTVITPTPRTARPLSTWHLFALWFDLGISFLVMVVGMFLVPGLGLSEALVAILVGALIGNALLGLAAIIGTDTGVPTMVLLRGVLGIRGSYLPTILNVLQLLGWAAFEVIVMSQAADTLATRFLGLPSAYPAWVVVFTAITLLMTLSGPIAVVRRYLARWAIWAVLVGVVWVTLALLLSVDLGVLLRQPGDGVADLLACRRSGRGHADLLVPAGRRLQSFCSQPSSSILGYERRLLRAPTSGSMPSAPCWCSLAQS